MASILPLILGGLGAATSTFGALRNLKQAERTRSLSREQAEAMGRLGSQRLEAPGLDFFDYVSAPEALDFRSFVREPGKLTPERVGFREVDTLDEAAKALKFTTGTAIPSLIPAAQQISRGMRESVREGLEDFLPGFDDMMGRMTRNIQDRQTGRLSAGTRRMLGRRGLTRGAIELGQDVTESLYTGFLGLTAEQQAAQGDAMAMQAAQMARGLFRVTGADQLLPYGGLTTAQAISSAFQNAEGVFRADSFNSQLDFRAQEGNIRNQIEFDLAALANERTNQRNLMGFQQAGFTAARGERSFQSNLDAANLRNQMSFLQAAQRLEAGGMATAAGLEQQALRGVQTGLTDFSYGLGSFTRSRKQPQIGTNNSLFLG